jgi:uncharacterized protein YdcH (DUF465 family)
MVTDMNDQNIKENLLKTNEEYRRLWEQHQSYEQRLTQLASKSFATDEEKLEVPTLKKKKLALKDQMQLIISQYRVKV